jgi:hypothetical protein
MMAQLNITVAMNAAVLSYLISLLLINVSCRDHNINASRDTIIKPERNRTKVIITYKNSRLTNYNYMYHKLKK